MPAEGAFQGDTLWLAGLTILLGGLWGVWGPRAARGRRWDRYDGCVALIVGGHLVSAAMVLIAGGDRRAAVNLAWEWVAVACMWGMLRAALRSAAVRNGFVHGVALSVVLLAALGYWQVGYSFPVNAREAGRKIQELERLVQESPGGTATAERSRRAQQLEQELAQSGVPSEPAARTMFLQRLLSTEPFATFALANTLAGVLLVGLLLQLPALSALLLRPSTASGYWKNALLAVLILGCLFLTKSRTAWVATAFALAVWGVATWTPRAWLRRERLWPVLLTSGGVVLLLAAITSLGGLDRQVLSEAPKSLQYRLEYWYSSLRMLRDHPLLGVGPGNFRPHYLQYKLAASSEEIADPHNWALDLWSGGGIIALAGGCWLAFELLRRLLRPARVKEANAEAAADEGLDRHVLGGLVASLALVFAGRLVWEGFDDLATLGCLGLGLVALIALRPDVRTAAGDRWLLTLAAVALGIHLLGAGGAGMPAVVGLMALLTAVGPGRLPEEIPGDTGTDLWPRVAAVACPCLLLGWAWTAALPVYRAQLAIEQGDRLGGSEASLRAYAEASRADPWSTVAPQRIASLRTRQMLESRTAASREEAYSRAKAAWQAAIDANPRNYQDYESLGKLALAWYDASPNARAASDAAAAYREAVARYPYNARLLAGLAIALDAGGDPSAAEYAARALEQNRLNERLGHRDRLLPPDQLRRIEAIAGELAAVTGPDVGGRSPNALESKIVPAD